MLLLPYLLRCDRLLLNRHFHYLYLLLRHHLVRFAVVDYLGEELLEQLLLHYIILDKYVLVLRIAFIRMASSQVLPEVTAVLNRTAVVKTMSIM